MIEKQLVIPLETGFIGLQFTQEDSTGNWICIMLQKTMQEIEDNHHSTIKVSTRFIQND